MFDKKPPPTPQEIQAKRDARALARLQSQNAQLRVDAQRYRKLQRQRTSNLPQMPSAEARPQFKLVDPRRNARTGSVVLPPLTPPLLLGRKMGAAIGAALKAMAIETRTLVKRLSKQPDAQAAMDAVSGDAQHELKMLRDKWDKRFAMLADIWSQRMVGGVIAQSSAQLNLSLLDMAEHHEITSTLQTPRMRAVVEAATQASVGLIVRIPERFLGAVQTQVMTAITTGEGLSELVPYLTKKYKGDVRHAHLTALDQIRKVSESVNATRLQSLGVEEYVWIATGGERYPRKLHHEKLNGRTFRYDDPPVIDERTGERGKPGDAINCRCRARPVVNFSKMREVA